MSSPLSGVPVSRRRHVAATLGLFSMLFIAVAAVAATGRTTGVVTACIVVALVVALLLALMAWGVVRSIQLETTERRIDAAIEEAVAAQGTTLRDLTCGCGHDHDPDALHVTDDPCARDGAIVGCSQTCETCVFSRLERTASAEVVRPRPQPGPRRPQPTPR